MLKEDILEYFIKNKEQTTLSSLADKFNVSKNACWKAINKLGEEGYVFNVDKKNGYFLEENDKLSEVAINMYSKYFKCIEVFDSVDSTSTYMKGLSNIKGNSVVVSNEQVSGRGRREKSFVSIKGKGAYFTFYIQDYISAVDISFVTICSAVAIRRCLSEVYELDTDIKWLNDIYYKNRKLAGILTEVTLSAEESCANELFIGVGINTLKVDNSIAEFATSIEDILSVKVNRNQLIANILNYFYDVYNECFKQGSKNKILEEYKSYQFIIGKQVTIDRYGNLFDAKIKSINDNAELIIEVDGIDQVLNSGTIILKE